MPKIIQPNGKVETCFSYSVSVMSQIVSTKRVFGLGTCKVKKSIATEIILTAKKSIFKANAAMYVW